MFGRLIQFYGVFEDFLPYVLVLGKRIRDTFETSVTSHMRLHADQDLLLGYGPYDSCHGV
jgi:hypothetical protein